MSRDSWRTRGRPPLVFGAVVLMHVLAGYALMSGLARKVVDVVRAPLQAQIIETARPPPPPPVDLPPPPVRQPPPPSFVPPPEVVVNPPPVQAPTITTTTVAPPPAPVTLAPPPAPEAPPAPPAVAARPAIANINACAPRGEDYPAAAVRAEATGITRIKFTIDGQGHLVKADIVKSAGASREHRMLDRLALDRLSQCKFTAGRDSEGRPIGATFDFEYVWNLK
jgi:protein TonB